MNYSWENGFTYDVTSVCLGIIYSAVSWQDHSA